MLTRFSLRLAEIAVTLLLALVVIYAWREARSDRAQLQSQLAAANQALAAASTRQQDRDTKLNDTLASIAAQKKSTITPTQLLTGITTELGLPAPLTLQPPTTADANVGAGLQPGLPQIGPLTPAGKSAPFDSQLPAPTTHVGAGLQLALRNEGSGPRQIGRLNRNAGSASAEQLPNAPAAQIPAADLKPLYDYILDCKACQAKLTAAQADLADEKSKTATLTKSRDEAVKAAKGGSVLQRSARALKWFALGAAAGAIAAKARH